MSPERLSLSNWTFRPARTTWSLRRRARRPVLAAIVLAVASLAGASSASAHTLVDPTTLTPPLKPFRVCFEDGPWVKCDTSGPTETYANRENTDFVSHAEQSTRVRR